MSITGTSARARGLLILRNVTRYYVSEVSRRVPAVGPACAQRLFVNFLDAGNAR